MEFSDTITSLEQFREVMEPPMQFVVDKEVSSLDQHCRGFIARTPFLLIASSDGNGKIDISPKGDAPGFVKVLDDTTLAIPDRKGNHRTDTFMNLLEHPWVGLIFLVPGHRNTLRLRGRAEIVRDREVREAMAVDGTAPDLAIGVHITTGYFHCAKCIIRSSLWGDTTEPVAEDRRLLAETLVEYGDLDISVDDVQAIIEADEVERLY